MPGFQNRSESRGRREMLQPPGLAPMELVEPAQFHMDEVLAMAKRRNRWKKAIITATLTTVPMTVFSSSANAFFPPIITIPPPVVVVPPPVVPPIVVPPVVPPIVVPPVVVPPVCPPPIVSPPTTVPEPATMVTALIGLGAAAGYRAIRGKKKDGESTKGQA